MLNQNFEEIATELLKAKGIGYFATVADLNNATGGEGGEGGVGAVGQIAYVGAVPPYTIYRGTGTSWESTGQTFTPTFDIDGYLKTADAAQLYAPKNGSSSNDFTAKDVTARTVTITDGLQVRGQAQFEGIDSGAIMTSGGDINTDGGDIVGVHNVTLDGDITGGRNLSLSGNISAGGDIEAGGEISATSASISGNAAIGGKVSAEGVEVGSGKTVKFLRPDGALDILRASAGSGTRQGIVIVDASQGGKTVVIPTDKGGVVAMESSQDGSMFIGIDGILTQATVTASTPLAEAIEAYWYVPQGAFLFRVEGDPHYYLQCASGMDKYGEFVPELGACIPYGGKLYLYQDNVYVYDGEQLRTPLGVINALKQTFQTMINNTFIIG